MSKTLKDLIDELTTTTILKENKIKNMFEEEIKEGCSEEEAAHNVRMRVKYMME